MLTKKSRMTSLVAIAATVMLVFSTNAANAEGGAYLSGVRSCRVNQVGEISAFVKGKGHLEAPGDNSRSRLYFNAPFPGHYVYKNAWSQGGGRWLAQARWYVSSVTTGCIDGNF